MTRKFTFLLMALLALTGFKSWGQETLTIYDQGTSTSYQIPINGYYFDSQGTISQFVIPSGKLGALQGKSISQLQFYIVYAESSTVIDAAEVVCNLAEVESEVMTSRVTSGLVEVFSGNMTSTSTTMTIPFSTPYNYGGGNLLVSIEVTKAASSCANYGFTGESVSYNAAYCYDWHDNFHGFLPKTTLTYEQGISCPAPTGLNASNITGTGATISWTGNGAESYDLAYGLASTFDLSNPSTYTLRNGLTTTSVQLTGLTAETEYKCAVKAHCSGDDESAWSSAVAFTPSAKTTLTVNDGTETNARVPFWGYNADYYNTQSQFIIPANQIENLAGGTITDLTFYVSSPENKEFLYNAWKVYVKEVDETSVGYVYIDFGSMTEVYSGGLNIVDNKLVVHFSTPYVYNSSKNLMIGFCQTAHYTYASTYWYGKSEGSEMRSRGGYGSDHASYTFLPKTTFTYIPGATRYNVTVDNAITGGSISANPTEATAGTVVSLSATPAYGYEFGAWVEDYDDVTIVDNQFTMPEHDVTISATFNALPKYAINSAVVTGGTVHAEYDNVTITEAPEGTVITLVAEAAEDYIFEYFTVDGVQIPGNTYTMGTSAIEIGASFRAAQSYTIHYYVNGVNTESLSVKENASIPTASPLADLVPAGTECIGWSFDDIATYQTVEPSIIGEGVHPTQECNVYAVFKCIETVISDNWEPIWAAPQDGEDVIFANYIWSEEYQRTICYVMCDRSFSSIPYFSSGECTVDTYGNIISTPENVTVFNVEILGNGNLKFHFNDISQGESTLADLDGSSLVPQSLWGGVDTWVNDWGTIYNTSNSSDYISCYENSGLIFCINTYNYSRMYRRASEENSYYMTEALGFGGANEHITANTSATNVVIANNAKLTIDDDATLNVEGICLNPSHDAAQLVIAEGGQLVHHNEGTVATFQKSITRYTGERDNYYLIANPTDNTTVANLTSNEFDLYTFDPTEVLEWQNQGAINNIDIVRNAGYLYANAATTTLQFRGELLPAGEATIDDLKYYDGNEAGHEFPGFNLIGNPFACNAYVQNYSFYTIEGDAVVAGTGAIAPCQGFMIETDENKEAVQLTTQAPEPAAAPSAMSIEVSQNRGNVIDRAIVRFDGANDLHKFMLNPQRTNIRLAKHGEEFAAISSEAEGEIPVSFKAEKNGSYTFNVNTENVEANYLHLIDNLTGMDTDLLSTPSYTFNASTSDYAYRFKLVFSMTDVEENESNANSFAYISNGNLVINNIEGEATMQIVDMLGRVVSTEIVNGSYNKALNLKAGLYIINLNGMTQKIVVK